MVVRVALLLLLATGLVAACAAEGGVSILPADPGGGETGTAQLDAGAVLIIVALVAIVAIAAVGLRR